MSNKETKIVLVRKSAPVLSSGFRLGVGDGLAVVDFIDSQDNENHNVIFSIALTKKQAKNLYRQLADFSESED